ncbi:MAG: hypothetical protein ACRDP6_36625 [Actinoallomurus sp.]
MIAYRSAGGDEIELWSLTGSRRLRTLPGHAGTVVSAGLTPDGSRAISAGRDQTLAADGGAFLHFLHFEQAD